MPFYEVMDFDKMGRLQSYRRIWENEDEDEDEDEDEGEDNED